MNTKIFVLSTKTPDVKLTDTWLKVKIEVKNDKISVKLNNKIVMDKFEDKDIASKQGSISFGVNGVEAAFSEVVMKSIVPPLGTPKSKDKDKKKGNNMVQMGSDVSQEEISTNVAFEEDQTVESVTD
eukprot:CAMPEP_0116979360 /NCGR_PEP_ID=MMETSP0467-20121206/58392_1 /TAXON_ID=283647 /ORGANISM="Mesodinium pulex, Strain SPMC105" /LENGTH=126 /DNA_ID=CAMNT_0004673029 /DNA_START=995 /DNA_END=1375 /DNA_ORIENTATION=-